MSSTKLLVDEQRQLKNEELDFKYQEQQFLDEE